MKYDYTKYYIVGDVHGMYSELMQLLDKIQFNPTNKEKLIFLGDMIDRGPDSYRVVSKIRQLQDEYGDDVIVLRGNHEQMAIDYLEGRDYYGIGSNSLFFHNGGYKTVVSYEQHGKNLAVDLNWFKSLPLCYEGESFIAVHAGFSKFKEKDEQSMIWIREEFLKLKEGTFDKKIIFGHTPVQLFPDYNVDGNELIESDNPVPMMVNGNVGIDTGCFFSKVLSAIVIEDGEITKVIQNK